MTEADQILAAFGMRAPKPRPSLASTFRAPSKNEAQWRARLGGQGQMRAYKPTAGERIESGLGGMLGRVVGEKAGKRLAGRAMAPLNDLTPVGDVVMADEAVTALKQGQTGKGAILASLTALGAVPLLGDVLVKGARPVARQALDALPPPKAVSGGISLSRDPKYASNIPYQQGNQYRAIGPEGLREFDRAGVVRANPNGKGGFDHAYFQPNHANDIYARGSGGDAIVESPFIPGRFESTGTYTRTLPGRELGKNDPVRVWRINPATGKHEIYFDNINARQVGSAAPKTVRTGLQALRRDTAQ